MYFTAKKDVHALTEKFSSIFPITPFKLVELRLLIVKYSLLRTMEQRKMETKPILYPIF